MDTKWMATGNCRTEPPSLFFPSDGVGVEVARRICADCPAKAPCLEYALANGIDHGVWGGASERERRRIARRRRLEAAAAGRRPPLSRAARRVRPGAGSASGPRSAAAPAATASLAAGTGRSRAAASTWSRGASLTTV